MLATVRCVVLAVAVLVVAARPGPGQPLLKKSPMDRAIDSAVAFLHNTQKTDGSWSGGRSQSIAVTSLAVMAMLSAGHVPGEGPYGTAIEKGVRWVLSTQKPNGLFAADGEQTMYHHGIATLMLSEVCGMVDRDLAREVRPAVEKAVAVILKAQRTDNTFGGGWRYQVNHVAGSDISVSGWQIMALRSARNLGCDVPAAVIDNAVAFLKRCQDSRTGGFRYMPGHQITTPCTGTSVLALELCGKNEHKSQAVLMGAAYLVRTEHLPRWNERFFFYGIYYGAQATFQVGGNYWSTYRTHLHRLLLQNQSSSGSWQGNASDSTYGANYCTAMAVLATTVEYRYLPIYQRGEEPTEKER